MTRVTPAGSILPTGMAPKALARSQISRWTCNDAPSDPSTSAAFIGLTIGAGPDAWWLDTALASARPKPTVPWNCTRPRWCVHQNSGMSITWPMPRPALALPVGSIAPRPNPSAVAPCVHAGIGTRTASERSPMP